MRPCWRARSERHTCSPVLTSMPMTVRCAIPMASPFVVRGLGGKQGKRLRRMIWPDPHRLLKKAVFVNLIQDDAGKAEVPQPLFQFPFFQRREAPAAQA